MDKLFIPEKIRVGFQQRKDTFTGKLGFITYVDQKGQLRQENAWQGWRDQKIPYVEFDNTPQSSFVFNKDVTRSGHWSTHSKVRIYDHRDFEFEIELSNMMYILMHSDVSKRDIQEQCIFGWEGKSLVLIPVNSEVYQKSIEHTRKEHLKFSLKDLVIGHTYSTKNDGNVVYMGFFDWSEKNWDKSFKGVGKKHIFSAPIKNNHGYNYGEPFVALSASDLYETVDNQISQNYATLMTQLEKYPGMKKTGVFSVKKGFENIGFKKTAYEVLMVNLKGIEFTISKIKLHANDDKPHYTTEKSYSNSYYDNHETRRYQQKMYNERVDSKNPVAVKEFFEKVGFGTLVFKKTTGEKIELV
jgi:hypothetical protein